MSYIASMRSPQRLAKIRLPLIDINSTALPFKFGYQMALNDSSEIVCGLSKPISPINKLESPMNPIATAAGFLMPWFLKKLTYSARGLSDDMNTRSDLLNDCNCR